MRYRAGATRRNGDNIAAPVKYISHFALTRMTWISTSYTRVKTVCVSFDFSPEEAVFIRKTPTTGLFRYFTKRGGAASGVNSTRTSPTLPACLLSLSLPLFPHWRRPFLGAIFLTVRIFHADLRHPLLSSKVASTNAHRVSRFKVAYDAIIAPLTTEHPGPRASSLFRKRG